jgi:uncharacterized protein (DUF983 family)
MKIVNTSNEAVKTAVEQDGKRAAAIEIAIEVGLLERCPDHGCVYDAMNDYALEDAFRCGESRMMQNDPLVAAFQGNRKRMHYVIENIRSGMPNSCPQCYYAQFHD